MSRNVCHMMMLVPVLLATYLTFSVEISEAIPLDQVVNIPLNFATDGTVSAEVELEDVVESVSVAE